ncbi:hypothetical protein ACSS6W_002880 [Trichoderma asperelloides]
MARAMLGIATACSTRLDQYVATETMLNAFFLWVSFTFDGQALSLPMTAMLWAAAGVV